MALGGLQGLEGNPEGLERLASEGGAADERAYLPAAAALVAGENVVVEDAPKQVCPRSSTYGFIAAAVEEARAKGLNVSHAHFRHLNPWPKNTGEVLRRFRRVLIPEMNSGQLFQLMRKDFLLDAVPLTKMQGKPFRVSEIVAKIDELMR